MHKTQETHISNREGKSHRVEKQSMGLLCMGCCVWFMGKIQGLWFSMDGLLGEEIGKETGPKGAFGFRKE
jgi:hypothetical protein